MQKDISMRPLIWLRSNVLVTQVWWPQRLCSLLPKAPCYSEALVASSRMERAALSTGKAACLGSYKMERADLMICWKELILSHPMCSLGHLWNVWVLLRFFEW